MGQTLANLGPQMGQAGQGFIQGRQMATQEDQSRQSMALRAAQEGRQKEEHRLSIQQLGLQIQDQQRQAALNAKLDPMRVEQGDQALQGGRDATPGYEDFIGGILGGGFRQNMRPDLTRDEVDSGAGMYLRDRGMDISGQRAVDAGQSGSDAFEREVLRGQLSLVRQEITELGKEYRDAKREVDKVRRDDPEHPDLAEMEADLQLILQEKQAKEAEVADFNSSLGKGLGDKQRVPPGASGRPKLKAP